MRGAGAHASTSRIHPSPAIASRWLSSPTGGEDQYAQRNPSLRSARGDRAWGSLARREHMFDIKSVSLDWAGRKLTLETGHVARQADGAVMATWGETAVLATVVYAKEPKPGQDFFPLTVNYQEKYFAAGRIPGGYFKREGRPTERETLLSRLIDRPIRPLSVEA